MFTEILDEHQVIWQKWFGDRQHKWNLNKNKNKKARGRGNHFPFHHDRRSHHLRLLFSSVGKGKLQKLQQKMKNNKVWIKNKVLKLRKPDHILSQKFKKLLCSQAKSYGPNQIRIEMWFQFVVACTKWFRVPNALLVCLINPILPEYASVKRGGVHPAASKQQPQCKQQMGWHQHLSLAYLSNKTLQM